MTNTPKPQANTLEEQRKRILKFYAFCQYREYEDVLLEYRGIASKPNEAISNRLYMGVERLLTQLKEKL